MNADRAKQRGIIFINLWNSGFAILKSIFAPVADTDIRPAPAVDGVSTTRADNTIVPAFTVDDIVPHTRSPRSPQPVRSNQIEQF